MAQIVRTVPLKDLGREITRMAAWVPEVGLELHRGVLEWLFLEVPGRSPVGRWGEDEHPGKYRGSHRASAGTPRYAQLPDKPFYAIPGASALAPVTNSMSAATPRSFLTNDAATLGPGGRSSRRRARRARSSYASALEAGHSPQAPLGIYGPALAEAARRGRQLGEAAIARAMRRFPR